MEIHKTSPPLAWHCPAAETRSVAHTLYQPEVLLRCSLCYSQLSGTIIMHMHGTLHQENLKKLLASQTQGQGVRLPSNYNYLSLLGDACAVAGSLGSFVACASASVRKDVGLRTGTVAPAPVKLASGS